MVLLLLLLLLLHELFRREQNFDDAVKVLKPKTLPAMREEEEGEERKCCRKSIRSKVYFLCLSEEKRAVTLNTNIKKFGLLITLFVSDSTPLATSRFQTCF